MPQEFPIDLFTWTSDQFVELFRAAQEFAPKEYRALVRVVQSDSFLDLTALARSSTEAKTSANVSVSR